jgi:capsular polysaccharide biosynthesis protein
LTGETVTEAMFSDLGKAVVRKGPVDGLKWYGWESLRGLQSTVMRWTRRPLDVAILDRDELQWRARAAGSLYYYGDATTVSFDPPVGPTPSDLRKFVGTYSLPQPFVASLSDVRLVGPYPVALADGKLLLEATVFEQMPLLNLAYTVSDVVSDGPRRTLGGGRTHLDSAVLLYNAWNRGYWHWVVDTLMRLEGVEAYTEATGDRPTLVVGPDVDGYQRETLELLGYGPDDWIEWDYLHATVDELVVPMGKPTLVNRKEGGLAPIYVDWLRERMRSAVEARSDQLDTESFSSRVYISRDDADRRGVSNERELVERLREYGFERYLFAEMDTVETIALLMQADIVVAPHGAGLTDILYADDAAVIELSRGTEPNTWAYYMLADQVGLRYRHLPCAVDGPDMRAHVDAVVSAVEAELDAAAAPAG